MMRQCMTNVAEKANICPYCGRVKTPRHKTYRGYNKPNIMKTICIDWLDETKIYMIKETKVEGTCLRPKSSLKP
jgi:hypothetical protein